VGKDNSEKRGTKKSRSTLLLGSMRVDIAALREIVNRVDEYIYAGTTPPEEELKSMETVIETINARYSSVFNMF
jgi:hypothetical protein